MLLEAPDDVFNSPELSTVFGQDRALKHPVNDCVLSDLCVCVDSSFTFVPVLFMFCFCFSFVWTPPKTPTSTVTHIQPISSALVIQASFPHKHTNCTFTNMGPLSLIANTGQQTHFGFHETTISSSSCDISHQLHANNFKVGHPAVFQINGYVRTVDETTYVRVPF
jgi:hypothetical protein